MLNSQVTTLYKKAGELYLIEKDNLHGEPDYNNYLKAKFHLQCVSKEFYDLTHIKSSHFIELTRLAFNNAVVKNIIKWTKEWDFANLNTNQENLSLPECFKISAQQYLAAHQKLMANPIYIKCQKKKADFANQSTNLHYVFQTAAGQFPKINL